MRYELFVALRYLVAQRKQTFVSIITLISIAGVAVGVAALIIARAVTTGFSEDLQAKILAANAHLLVWGQGAGRLIEAPDGVAATLEALPGVAAVAPLLHGGALAVGRPGREPTGVEVFGVDPEREARVTGIAADMVEGRLLDLDPEGHGLILGATLAEDLGLEVGDDVRLVLPQVTVSPLTPPIARSRLFRVVGLFSSGFYQSDAGRVYLHLDAAGPVLAGREGRVVNTLAARVRDLRDLPGVRRAAVDALGERFVIRDVADMNRSLWGAMRTEKLVMSIAIGLIMIVAALNIVSTLVLLVMEKVRDIGALVALGARARGIVLIFMSQGVIIGCTGALIGTALGSGACWVLDGWRLIRLPPEVYYLSYVPFRTSPGDVLFAAALALGVSFTATLYPALKAARLDPVEALRHE